MVATATPSTLQSITTITIGTMKKRNKVTYADFNKLEKIRVYMEHHKEEVFTPEFMKLLADRYLNYFTVRNRIKKLYPTIVRKLIENNVINIIPNEKELEMKDAPLYSQDDFLYYFENRLNKIVKNEVEANFRECFYGLPF